MIYYALEWHGSKEIDEAIILQCHQEVRKIFHDKEFDDE